MNYVREVIVRLRAGQSERGIAQDLQLSRNTVKKYRLWAEEHNCLQADSAWPGDASLVAALGEPPRPPRVESSVEPYRAVVQKLVEQGLEMVAIFQRLSERGYTGSYSSVRRFVHHLRPAEPSVVARVHSAPGEEAQVDFGGVGQLYDPVSKRLRPAHVFVATLCYSRHQYAELVFDQKIPTWLGCHRRAFESWGGVPQRIVIDNLKAGVAKVLLHDPVLGEAYRRFAQHYGFLVSPTRPYTPRHKGKVENGVHYVQRNFMAGQEFADIYAANQHLKVWVRDVAGARQHGTTHQAPLALFNQYEQAALLPLAAQAFTLCDVKIVTVHPDCHVEINGSYYSAPHIYVGQRLEAYVHEHVVALHNGAELLVTHERSQKPGEWHTRLEDYPPDKAAYLQRTPAYCRQEAARLGQATSQVIQALLAEQPLDRLRSAQAILRLEETVGPFRLEAACARALHFGDTSYRRIKSILNAALDREQLPELLAPTPGQPQPHRLARPGAEFFQERLL